MKEINNNWNNLRVGGKLTFKIIKNRTRYGGCKADDVFIYN